MRSRVPANFISHVTFCVRLQEEEEEEEEEAQTSCPITWVSHMADTGQKHYPVDKSK